MSSDAAPRLYLVSPQQFDPDTLAALLERILAESAIACVRLNMKSETDEAEWTRAVNHILPVCHRHDIPLLVTDHFRLVEPLGLDGVHLSNNQTSVRKVRQVLGNDRIIGASAGASQHQGIVLAEAGVDYICFGPVRDDGALGDDVVADDALFSWWAEVIETPCVAEGGVELEDVARLAAIADFFVPAQNIWTNDDPASAIKAFAAALSDAD